MQKYRETIAAKERARLIRLINSNSGEIIQLPKSEAMRIYGLKKDGINKAIRTGHSYKGWIVDNVK